MASAPASIVKPAAGAGPATPVRTGFAVEQMHFKQPLFRLPPGLAAAYSSPSDAIRSPASVKLAQLGRRPQKSKQRRPLFARSLVQRADSPEQPMFEDIPKPN